MFTAGGKEVLDQRISAFYEWLKSKLRFLKSEFSIDYIQAKTIVPTLEIELSGDVRVIFPKTYEHLVPKGLCVRLELLAILDEIDHRDLERRSDSYFIQIDGSGAFNYDSIIPILEKLGHQNPVVLGVRDPQSSWGMGPGRKEIELFEKFLLEQKYSEQITTRLRVTELPDAQAGCWGIHLGRLKELPLTARKYGLEFDLIASALAAGLPISFVNVTLAAVRTASAFTPRDSLDKMKFIRHKLGYSVDEIVQLLDEYLRKYAERILSPEYVTSIRDQASRRRISEFDAQVITMPPRDR